MWGQCWVPPPEGQEKQHRSEWQGQHSLGVWSGAAGSPRTFMRHRNMLVWETYSPVVSLDSKLQFIQSYMSFLQRAIHTLTCSFQTSYTKVLYELLCSPLHDPHIAVWASSRISVGWPIQDTWGKQWRLGPCGRPPAPGVLDLLWSPQHFCCHPVQAWSTPALPEPVFIKMLWLEPLKTCRRIFMSNLLVFFKCQQSNLFFWLFLCCIRRNQFPTQTARWPSLRWNRNISFFFFLLTIVLPITELFLP